MAFIETISKVEAAGTVKALYEAAEETSGYIPNYLKLFSHRPEVYIAWQNLSASIRRNMSFRRYELVTLAAARALEGTYCMVAHGETLLNSREVDQDQLTAIAYDYHHADLAPDEVAVMEFAEKVITNPNGVTQVDIDYLKDFGLSDAAILDITLAAAVRSFFSNTLSALNAEPDAKFMGLNEGIRDALAVGRPLGSPELMMSRF